MKTKTELLLIKILAAIRNHDRFSDEKITHIIKLYKQLDISGNQRDAINDQIRVSRKLLPPLFLLK